MKPTQEEVLKFMAQYQTILSRPPTMNEIVASCPSLNWRSSARYVIQSLLKQGLLEIVAPSGCGRRYKVK